jgi:magnesium-protoporphyrin O-methyltransferase
MTCGHCCGADQLFDLKGAQKEMKKYRKKGPGKSTKTLIETLFSRNTENKTLLDVGGGIGALQWYFLENGGLYTKGVDASRGYLHVAGQYAKEKGWKEQTSFLFGDLVNHAKNLTAYDFVTLDKVICCYPDYEALLTSSLEKCTGTIGVVYPLGGLLPKLLIQFNRLYFYITKNPFRTYIHSPKAIREFINSHGFTMVSKKISFPWHVQVYQRRQ